MLLCLGVLLSKAVPDLGYITVSTYMIKTYFRKHYLETCCSKFMDWSKIARVLFLADVEGDVIV